MRSMYAANPNNPYHAAYRNATLQKKIAQSAYLKRQQTPLKPNYRYSPTQSVQNEPHNSCEPNHQTPASFIKFEKSQLPHYVLPILYSPTRIMEKEELTKNEHLNQLFQKKSYEKICHGVPVTSLGENRLMPYKNYRDLTQTTSLSQSETEVYSKLMQTMYGNKDIKVNSLGDYSQWYNQQARIECPKQSVNHLANRLNRMYLETSRDYNNPNYHSDSEYSSLGEVSLYNDKLQAEQRVQMEDSNATVNNPPDNITSDGTSFTTRKSKGSNYYHTVGCENYGNASKRYAHYGILEEDEQKEYQKIETKLPTVIQAKALEQEEQAIPKRNDDKPNESKSTQTLSIAGPPTKNKRTQTSHKKHSKSRSPSKLKKIIEENERSDANITVIIDRGWKEDVYSIAGSPTRSDSSVAKNESVTVIDLQPVVPCLQVKDKEVARDMSPVRKRSTCTSGVNTNISLCKRKYKPKRLIH